MQVGSLVLCVDVLNCKHGEEAPIKESIYTIREILKVYGQEAVRLEEIINAPQFYLLTGYAEIAFRIEHFKELQSPMEIDIEYLIKEPFSV